MACSATGNQCDDQWTLLDEVVTAENLAQLRGAVLQLAAKAGLSADRADGFVIAVNEAVTNAIEHAGGRGELAVVRDDQRRLVAEVRDAGADTARSITLTRPPREATRGLGLWLAGQLTDRVEVRGGPAGTTVHLEMNLDNPQPHRPG